MDNLFQELKRRKVFRVAIVYAVVAWLLIQIAGEILPTFNAPEWVNQTIIFVLILGFPLAVILAWAFEITPEGIKADSEARKPVSLDPAMREVSATRVEEIAETLSPVEELARPATEAATPISDKSIAVLPLANLSPDPNNAYFAAGVHEEILNQLAKIADIQVLSRTAVLRFQDTIQSPSNIAQELNVAAIMEGSVRFAGNRVAITTQLIRAIDDIHLWSETYQFELDDILAIQSDVALQVAHAMQATLLPSEIASIERPVTESTEAYTLFLQHRHQQELVNSRPTLDEDGWMKAGIRKIERAVNLDPLFAQGMAELGWMEWYIGAFSPLEELNYFNDEALHWANKAIEIDPTISRAYTALQMVYFERRQWDEWESAALKSVELPDPDGRAAANFAMNLSRIGQYQKAYHWFDVAISKNPSLNLHQERAVVARIYGGDYETALAMVEQSHAVGGDENAYHVIRAYVLDRMGRKAESLDEFSKVSKEPMVTITRRDVEGYYDYLRCQLGEQDSVMEELTNLDIEPIRESRIRYCASSLDDINMMFESFHRTMNTGRNIFYTDVITDEVRADPRWQEIEEYMNLPAN